MVRNGEKLTVNNFLRVGAVHAAVGHELRRHVVGLKKSIKVYIDDREALFCARRFLRFLCHAVDHTAGRLIAS